MTAFNVFIRSKTCLCTVFFLDNNCQQEFFYKNLLMEDLQCAKLKGQQRKKLPAEKQNARQRRKCHGRQRARKLLVRKPRVKRRRVKRQRVGKLLARKPLVGKRLKRNAVHAAKPQDGKQQGSVAQERPRMVVSVNALRTADPDSVLFTNRRSDNRSNAIGSSCRSRFFMRTCQIRNLRQARNRMWSVSILCISQCSRPDRIEEGRTQTSSF